MPHVFLSYAKEDTETVRRAHARLQKDGMQVWIDEHDLLPGQEWESAIQKAIRTSGAFVVFLSHNAVSKTGHFQKEIREALEITDRLPDGKVFIVPVRLDDCQVPERLKRWHWIDLYKRGGYHRLRAALVQHVGEPVRAQDKVSGPLTLFENPGDHLLYETISSSGRFLYARLDRKYHALSQGHFILVRKGMPPVLQHLRQHVADSRRLARDIIQRTLSSRSPWRRPAALVYGSALHQGMGGIVFSSDEGTTCVNLNYWRLALLYTLQPKVYVTKELGDPVYIEQDDRTVMVIMPIRMGDQERARVAIPRAGRA